VFTAVFSRHQFVWPTFSQSTADVIEGFEAAWWFFGGVFPVVIPDNMGSIVVKAEDTAPRFNDVFVEYAQSRGFVVDAARVATPTDKPASSGWFPTCAPTSFPARTSPTSPTAGSALRPGVRRRPACASTARASAARARPSGPRSCRGCWRPRHGFDTPKWYEPKVHRDFHAEVGKAFYSAPHQLIGRYLKARRDSNTVKLTSAAGSSKCTRDSHPVSAGRTWSTCRAERVAGSHYLSPGS